MKESTTEMYLKYRAHIADMSRRLRKTYYVPYEDWLFASRACGFIK